MLAAAVAAGRPVGDLVAGVASVEVEEGSAEVEAAAVEVAADVAGSLIDGEQKS